MDTPSVLPPGKFAFGQHYFRLSAFFPFLEGRVGGGLASPLTALPALGGGLGGAVTHPAITQRSPSDQVAVTPLWYQQSPYYFTAIRERSPHQDTSKQA